MHIADFHLKFTSKNEQDSLFQACSGGMCFLQVHIRLQFQIKISFQSPIDLAHMNIMGVYAL